MNNLYNNPDTYFHFDHFEERTNSDPLALFKMIQLGDVNCTPNYIGPLHLQMCYEISYVVSGKGYFVCDNIKYPVQKGDICINRLNEEHYVLSSSYDPMRFFYIGFTFTGHAGSAEEQISEIFDKRENPVCKSRSNNIYSLFLSLLQEIKSSDDFSDTIINCCINHLVYLVCRNYSSVNNSAEYNVKRVKKPEEIVYEIINFIDNNTRSIKKLNELSNYLGYNYSYISALFSRQTGQNIKEYFDEKRISLACELLSHGYSITDTVYELNFESVQSFNRAFKRIMGVSPGNFNHKTSRD